MPLKKSILFRCILFIAVLCAFLSVVNYFSYRNALYQRYRDYITDLLRYAAANIDVDDMKECLAKGEKSQKYLETQVLFDQIKDTHNIDFIYVIDPLNTNPEDNIMNIIAGMSTYEKNYIPENEVTLGGLTGTDYTPETAAKYYNAKDLGDEITFFEEWADRWGSDYTGILSLYDSDGNYFAELCVDVSVTEIRNVIRNHLVACVLIIVVVGILFMVLFLTWTRHAITDPIQLIETKVVELADRSHGQTDPNALVIDMPDIRTKNELKSLSEAIVRLSQDMRNYLVNALSAKDDAAVAHKKAMEMTRQAERDSLTGIRNRHAYDEEVKRIEWRMKSEDFRNFGIGVVDLNFLKRINDTFGHEKGNQAIVKICAIVCRVFSHSPVFRIGGDEFVIVLANDDFGVIDEKIAEFERVLESGKNDKSLEPWEQVSAAIGWSAFDPDQDHHVEDVFKRADHNMYENKKKMKAVREG